MWPHHLQSFKHKCLWLFSPLCQKGALKTNMTRKQSCPVADRLPGTPVGWRAGLEGAFWSLRHQAPGPCQPQFHQDGRFHLTILFGLTAHHTINCLNKFQRAHQLLLMNSESGHPELQSITRCLVEEKGVERQDRMGSFPPFSPDPKA